MKIRGNTVGTPIKPEKVLVKCQNLTEEEKIMARQNIGAGGSLLTVFTDGDTSSHTPAEIITHVQAGGTVICKDDGGEFYALLYFFDGLVYFGHINKNGTSYGYIIQGKDDVSSRNMRVDASNAVLYTAQTLDDEQKSQARENIGAADESDMLEAERNINQLVEAVNSLVNSIAPLYVTIDPDTDLVSESTQRMQEHVRNGGDVFLRVGLVKAALTHSYGSTCYFAETSVEESYVTQWVVYDDGTYECFSQTIATQESVDNKLTSPATAKVGQTIVVKSVDSTGKPTAWEAADLPSGTSCNCPPILIVRLSETSEKWSYAGWGLGSDPEGPPSIDGQGTLYRSDKSVTEIRNALVSGAVILTIVSDDSDNVEQHPEAAITENMWGVEIVSIGSFVSLTTPYAVDPDYDPDNYANYSLSPTDEYSWAKQ